MTGNGSTRRRQHPTVDDSTHGRAEPIAIVGIGLRFPGGSESPGDFARFLREGRSGIRPVPADRWDVESFTASGDGDEPGKIRSARGGFLDRIDEFDAQFFNISPKEAQFTDPQQRLLLETTWQALEQANIDPTALRRGNGGVYVGASSIDYALELDSVPYADLDGHLASGITFFPLSGRLSYFLGWRGPCMTIDTACASSLTALHQAVNGLRNGECEIALCAGVNALHHPRIPVIFSNANMLAPDGECKTFDEAADGYVRAEGCGALVLKRLSDARAAGDDVLAVIRGSAVGQDGDSAGLTVPNGSAQEAVIRTALERAGLEPGAVQYVEAHGTGTALGDPIEMGAISDVFSSSHTPEAPLTVASVKTNFGHMEPVAGIAGVIKTVLQMREGVFYPHLNLNNPSPRIPWDQIPVTVPTEIRAWDAPIRRAVVNSFGFGGTIAAAVLEQAPPVEAPAGEPAISPEGHIFTLSAKNKRAMTAQLERYRDHLAAHPDTDLADLCYSSNVGRAHFTLRVADAVTDRKDLDALLQRSLAAVDRMGNDANPRKVAFLFTGQGAQYAGMGAALHRQYPVFSAAVDECDRLFAEPLGRSVAALLLGVADDPEVINQTRFTQAALFTMEYALAQLWLSWGVRPNVLIGHSIGEVVAATIAGVFTLPDAVTLVAARGRLMQSVSAPGGMLAVTAAVEDVEPLLEPYPNLAVAAVNSPRQCVVSGASGELAGLTATLAERDLSAKALAVSHAFHSPLMHEVFDDFRAAIAGLTFAEPALTLISNVTGKVARAEITTPDYWVRHIGAPVLFEAGMRALARRGNHAMIEIGPSTALTSLAKQCVPVEEHRWITSLTTRDTDGGTLRRALAQVYTLGLPVSWAGYHRDARRNRVDLPTYAFDRKRYWLPVGADRRGTPGSAAPGATHHPLLGEPLPGDESGTREFRAWISADSPAYLADHRVNGQALFPGTGYVEILLALQEALHGETTRAVTDLRILEPLFLGAERAVEVRTRVRTGPDGAAVVQILSRAEGEGDVVERCHATAVLPAEPSGGGLSAAAEDLLTAERTAGPAETLLPAAEVYAEFAAVGMEYGPEFQRVHQVTRHAGNLAVASVRGADTGALEHLPPAVMDGAMHTLVAVAPEDGNNYLPVRFGTVRLHKKPKSDRLRAVLRLAPATADGIDLSADLVVLEDRRVVFELLDLGLKRVSDGNRRHFLHRQQWTKRSLVAPPATGDAHVLVVGPQDAGLAGQAAEAGLRLTFAENAAGALKLLRDHASVTDLCWFWTPGQAAPEVDAIRAESEQNYRDLLELVHGLDEAGGRGGPRLWLVTRRAQWLPDDRPHTGENLAAATLWGFGHVLLNEQPLRRCTMVDLGGPADLGGLVAEWRAPDSGEFQVAFRDGVRHVRRLRPAPSAHAGDVALTITEYGRFAGIRALPVPEVAPTGDRIQVRVRAAGLNFKDVLNALGMLGVDGQPLGFECSGTVVAAGPQATHRVGDEVLVNYLGCLRSVVTVPSAAAATKPGTVTHEQAAGLPSAYVTAHYALHHLAGIKAGDRVLIHAAAGGVGQAAVQLAQQAGAEVFATASPHKWALLRSQGVRHVMNSRSLDFADEILRDTGGAGVDIVLNSLNKDFIPAAMRCLATGGRFVELGKVGAWTTEQVREVRPDAVYHNFDLSEQPEDEVLRLNQEILAEVTAGLARGELRPLPVTTYTLDEAEEAFGVLSRGANIGKLVIGFGAETPARPVTVRPDRTYVVTGGLGGFGLITAEKLVDLGARHLVLVSRRAEPVAEAAVILDRLRSRAEVTVHPADIGDPADVRRLTAHLTGGPYPVGGIVHAAGGLGDAPVSAQTWESVDDLFRSKVYGGLLLHEASRSFAELDFFLFHSSAAAVVGGASQSNYAAANAFLDTLVQWRVRQGLPALGINWGPLAEVGMSARLSPQHVRSLENEGIRFFTPAKAMRSMAALLARGETQVVAGECDWNRFVAGKAVRDALYGELVSDTGAGEHRLDLDALVVAPKAERDVALNQFIRTKLAEVLHIDAPDEIDSSTEFVQLGLDSLMAVELKNALENALRVPLPASLAFDHPTPHVLTEFLGSLLVPSAEEVSS